VIKTNNSTKHSYQNSKEQTRSNFFNIFTNQNKEILFTENHKIEDQNILTKSKEEFVDLLTRKSYNMNGTEPSFLQKTQSDNKCFTDFNVLGMSKRKLSGLHSNPYLFDNLTEKQILNMANKYITTDESLDKFEKQQNAKKLKNLISDKF